MAVYRSSLQMRRLRRLSPRPKPSLRTLPPPPFSAPPLGPFLLGKTVVVVGNGPSAPQYADAIDACEVVVRCNAFPPDEAGKKWDVWYSAFFGLGLDHQKVLKMFDHPNRAKWIWMPGSIDPKACPFHPERFSFISRQRIGEIALLTNKLSKVPRGHHPQTGKIRPIQPTSGMFAIDMALTMQPKTLIIVGFDAKSFGAPGWSHYGSHPAPWAPERPSASGGKHDYELQTAMQEKWLATREFYGRKYPDTEPQWWRLKP